VSSRTQSRRRGAAVPGRQDRHRESAITDIDSHAERLAEVLIREPIAGRVVWGDKFARRSAPGKTEQSIMVGSLGAPPLAPLVAETSRIIAAAKHTHCPKRPWPTPARA
jgi:hypothetical protein